MSSESPILLVHGFTGTPASWDPVLDSLGEYRQPVVRPALLGHGGRDSIEDPDAPGANGFEDEVDRLAAMIRPTGQPASVVGYSLGGRIALGLVVRHPELIRAAILVGAHPGLETRAEREVRRAADAQWAAILRERGIEHFVDRWENLPLFESQRGLPSHVLEAQRATRLGHDPEGLAVSLERLGLGSMPSMWAALLETSVPSTWVVGEYDAKFRSLAERAVESAPHAKLVVVPKAGHNVPLEAPDALARLIVERVEPR